MKTLHNKLVVGKPIDIEGPIKAIDKGYPLPSNFYLDLIYDNHKCRFGYFNKNDAEEDKEFIEKNIL